MTEQKQVVGIDVSKNDLQVHFIAGNSDHSIVKGTHKFTNNEEGHIQFLRWVLNKSKETDVYFVMEATGVYHENLAYFLYEMKQRICVVLPSRIKHFAKSLNIKTKNDSIDAKIISLFGMQHQPQMWQPVTKEWRDLRTICREILACKKQMSSLKNQLHALQCTKQTQISILQIKQQQIDVFENSIIVLEQQVRLLVEKDTDFARKITNLETIKGLRFLTIVTIVSETNGFENAKGIRNVVSYAGLDVCEHQSGMYAGKTRITKKGNSNIRQCLYMPALSAIQHNEPIKNLHKRIVERNPQIKQKGVVAAMRKLLILTYVLWKNNQPYDPEYNWSKR